jgi:hypothetical protein
MSIQSTEQHLHDHGHGLADLQPRVESPLAQGDFATTLRLRGPSSGNEVRKPRLTRQKKLIAVSSLVEQRLTLMSNHLRITIAHPLSLHHIQPITRICNVGQLVYLHQGSQTLASMPSKCNPIVRALYLPLHCRQLSPTACQSQLQYEV